MLDFQVMLKMSSVSNIVKFRRISISNPMSSGQKYSCVQFK